jgi:hypothetical protein
MQPGPTTQRAFRSTEELEIIILVTHPMTDSAVFTKQEKYIHVRILSDIFLFFSSVTSLPYVIIIIIIISLPQSTAGHRPLQILAISLDLRLLAYILPYVYVFKV